ncbi:MAG: SDR family oxidoreductase [Bacteroidota bacterium]
MKILITGSNGLLGQKIVKLCLKYGIQFLATSKGENRNPDCPESNYFALDITNKLEINGVFEAFYPTHVIHTAAITNVDQCESDKNLCKEVNIDATNSLFHVSKRFFAHFLLVSTDFVFDGTKGMYNETDVVNPLSYYAESKVQAENFLISSEYKNWSIARTIIVFGQGNNLSRSNIVLWVKDSLSNKQEIKVVNDQFRCPTWAEDLAWGCIAICEKSKTGIYHLSGKEYVSMYNFALQIADFYNLDKSLIDEISSASLNQTAKRPLNTGFDISKAQKELGYEPKALEECLELIY